VLSFFRPGREQPEKEKQTEAIIQQIANNRSQIFFSMRNASPANPKCFQDS